MPASRQHAPDGLTLHPSFTHHSSRIRFRRRITKGRALAEANCARCHNLEKTGDSPFVPAPPFRIISKNYKPSDLEEALVEGIVVGHPAMPEFELTGEQAAALGAFIDSLGR